MLPKVHSLLILVLLSTSLTIDARRSRIDLPVPIANADEAPASDNMATASGSEPQEVKAPAPVADDEVVSQSSVVAPDATSTLANMDSSAMAVGEIEEECDPDMIGFEIVTG